MKKTNKLYLEQFLERIERIELYVTNVTKEQFFSDNKMQDALIYNIEVLGEISKRFSEQYKTDVSEIPWHKIQGMRNRLVHNYDGISLEIIWEVSTTFVPTLKPIVLNQINTIDITKY